MYFRCLILLLVALAASVHLRDLDKRRINGIPAEIEEFPWLVFVGSDNVVCNGAILSKYYVLTAASCVTEPLNDLLIHAGSKYKNSDGSLHHLANVTLHQDFSVDDNWELLWEYASRFDIAVVKVVEPFVYDKTRRPIRLVEPGHQPRINASAVGAGFGIAEILRIDQLTKLDVHVVDTKACNESYASWGGISVGQFCASNADLEHKYRCGSDLGSPLVYNSTTGEKMLVGISIYGDRCEIYNSPLVYSDVGYLRSWIDQHVVYDKDEDKVSQES